MRKRWKKIKRKEGGWGQRKGMVDIIRNEKKDEKHRWLLYKLKNRMKPVCQKLSCLDHSFKKQCRT